MVFSKFVVPFEIAYRRRGGKKGPSQGKFGDKKRKKTALEK